MRQETRPPHSPVSLVHETPRRPSFTSGREHTSSPVPETPVGESDRDGQQGHQNLLAKLSLKDEVSLLTGTDYSHLRGHPGIGLRSNLPLSVTVAIGPDPDIPGGAIC